MTKMKNYLLGMAAKMDAEIMICIDMLGVEKEDGFFCKTEDGQKFYGDSVDDVANSIYDYYASDVMCPNIEYLAHQDNAADYVWTAPSYFNSLLCEVIQESIESEDVVSVNINQIRENGRLHA